MNRSENHAGPAVGDTLVRFNDWLTSINTEGWENQFAMEAIASLSDQIENVAAGLIETASGLEQSLLSKSLQEALLYCGESDLDGNYSEFKDRLTRSHANHGASPLLQQFLSFYFFNFVWFETGESFRAQAQSAAEFEKDIEDVEAICQKVVEAIWKQFELQQRPLELSAARELIAQIELELRGPQAEEPS